MRMLGVLLDRGQIGIEFFLIMGFSLTIVAMLIANSERQLVANEQLDTDMLSLSAMNAVSNAANSVTLMGNGSSLRANVFIPSDARCFVPKTSSGKNYLACDVGDTRNPPRMAYGMMLVGASAPVISDDCYNRKGWISVIANSTGPASPIGVYCSAMP